MPVDPLWNTPKARELAAQRRPGALIRLGREHRAWTLAVLYLPLAAWGLPPAWWLAAAAVSGLSLPPMLTQVFAQTPLAVRDHHANEANAWVVSAFAIGAAAGTLVSGFAVQWRADWGITLALGIGVLVAAACATAASPHRLALTRP